ncbi:MAG TPA: LptE family protein [Phycisphaerales bacterium]|nr:LptE family protein [Phycisphaerales bacterium]
MIHFRIMAIACLGVALACQHGCASDPTQGYAAMTTFPQTVATIAIPIFENDTFQRDVEFELADALVKEIERRTPYRVATEARADTMLSGRITRTSLQPLSRSRLTGLTEEMLLGITVDFQWIDLRTNVPIVERRSFTVQGLFLPSRPFSEPIELGEVTAVQQLARDIVNELQAAW